VSQFTLIARTRPRGRRNAEQRDELAPPHLITSSAAKGVTIDPQPYYSRGLQLHDQFKLVRSFDRQVHRLRPFEYLVHVVHARVRKCENRSVSSEPQPVGEGGATGAK